MTMIKQIFEEKRLMSNFKIGCNVNKDFFFEDIELSEL